MVSDGPPLRVRVEDASLLEDDAAVRVVVSGLADPATIASSVSSSGAKVEVIEGRLRAVTTPRRLVDGAGRIGGAQLAGRLEATLEQALVAWRDGAVDLVHPGGAMATSVRPHVMAVLNVTPDSFSDGGAHYDAARHPAAAIEAAIEMVEAGADVIDVGGESTRPGAPEVDADEESRRVLPVVEALAAAGHVVSIDTTKSQVAQRAVDAGAVIVNDVSGGRTDRQLLDVVGESGAAYVAMHMQGTPRTMQEAPTYVDVVAEVFEKLASTIDRALAAGIPRRRIAVDPGIGFGKTVAHNLVLLRRLREFSSLGRPVLIGTSRKSFLGAITGVDDPEDRLTASLTTAALAIAAGASIVRVHDVAETVRAVKVAAAVSAAGVLPRVAHDAKSSEDAFAGAPD